MPGEQRCLLPRRPSGRTVERYLPDAIDWTTVTSPDWLLDRSTGQAPSSSWAAGLILMLSLPAGLTDQQKQWYDLRFLDDTTISGSDGLERLDIPSRDLHQCKILYREKLASRLVKAGYLLISLNNHLRWARLPHRQSRVAGHLAMGQARLPVEVLMSSRENKLCTPESIRRRYVRASQLTALDVLQYGDQKSYEVHDIGPDQIRAILNSAVGGLEVTDPHPSTTTLCPYDLVVYSDPYHRKKRRSGWVMNVGRPGSEHVQVWSAYNTVCPIWLGRSPSLTTQSHQAELLATDDRRIADSFRRNTHWIPRDKVELVRSAHIDFSDLQVRSRSPGPSLLESDLCGLVKGWQRPVWVIDRKEVVRARLALPSEEKAFGSFTRWFKQGLLSVSTTPRNLLYTAREPLRKAFDR